MLHGLFKQIKRIQIVNVLKDECAKYAPESLKTDVSWKWRNLLQGGYIEYSQQEYAGLPASQLTLLQSKHWEMDFVYQQFKPAKAKTDSTANSPYIDKVVEYLGSDHFIGFLTKLTGCEQIHTLDTRGTCLLPGHFFEIT